MGTTAQKLSKILESKADIKSAIESKNVEIGQDAKLSEYGDKIRSIYQAPTYPQPWISDDWTHIWVLFSSDMPLRYGRFLAQFIAANGFDVDWGDGVIEHIAASTTFTTRTLTHVYDHDGDYRIDIYGYDSIRLSQAAIFGDRGAYANPVRQLQVGTNDTPTTGNWAGSPFTNCVAIRLGEGIVNQENIQQGSGSMKCIELSPTTEVVGSSNGNFMQNASNLEVVKNAGNAKIVRSCAYCTSLKDIDLHSAESTMNGAFQYCSSLEEVNLSSIKALGSSVFQHCSSLKTVGAMPNLSTLNGSTFYYCTSLISVDAPECTSVGSNCFNGCTSLESVNMPKCQKLESRAFIGCTNLKVIDFPELTNIASDSWSNDKKIEFISLPKITALNAVFSDCENLTYVNLPVCTSLPANAFKNCANLSTFDFPMLESVGTFGFQNCTSLTSLEGMPNLKTIGNTSFQGTSLERVPYLEHLETIGDNAFNSLKSLIEVDDLPNLTAIGYGAFSGCENLDHVGDLPLCETIGGSAFYNCRNLRYIRDLSNLKSIGVNAFSGCNNLALIGFGTKTSSGIKLITNYQYLPKGQTHVLRCADGDFYLDNSNNLIPIS